MSLDIQIKVDPGNSAAATDKVTQSLHRAEDQGKKTQISLAGVSQQMRQMAGAAGFSLKEAQQGLREVGKGVAMLALRDTIGAVTGEVSNLTDGLVQLGGVGTSVGMSLGGVKGAIAGFAFETAVRGVQSLTEALLGVERMSKAERKAIYDYLEAVRQEATLWGQITGELEVQISVRDQIAKLREKEKDVSWIGGANKLIKEQSDGYQRLKDDVTAYTFALMNLQEQQDKSARSAATQLELARGLRDARIRQVYAERGYSAAVADSIVQQNQALDKQVDMARAVADGVLGVSALNKELGINTSTVNRVADGYERWHGILVKISQEQRNMAVARDPGIQSATQGFALTVPTDIASPATPTSRRTGNHEGLHTLANDTLPKVEEKLTSINDLFQGQLINSAAEFASLLVDTANGAETSFKEFGLSTLRMFEQMIAKALVLQLITGSVTGAAGANGKFGGLFGALGFATGGSAMMATGGLRRIPGAATGMDAIMGGAGSTDSRLAMLRMTPGESLHVRTPEQRAAAQRPQGGGTVVQNHVHFDRRDLLAAIGTTEGKAAIVNVISSSPGLVRSILGR